MESLITILGLAGVLAMLVAYYLLQQGKFTSHQPLYLWMNFAGGIAVIISLCVDWNLSAFVMELAWVLISGYSIFFRKEASA